MSTKSNEKRNDLQCWRAISILAVLLFHILPKKFPNGFLGVDIFFLLSGFLMASLYSFENNILKSTINFYYRRIKRILPIYIFVIFITLILLAKNVFPEEYKLILEDSKWAIFLATNYEDLLKQRGYFETESNYRFFRHCWSLAVEMQFYLIFPFIAIIRSKISPIKYKFLLVLILVFSLGYQIMTPNKIMQYESLFCRIWQFSLGMLAQTFPTLSLKWLNPLLLLTTIFFLFCPFILPSIFASFLVLISTAILISTSNSETDPFKALIFVPEIILYLVKLGDISYILYLIHWPLITYSHSISASNNFTYYEGFLLFMTSLSVSIIAHKYVEKPLLRVCNNYKNLFIVLFLLYANVIYLSNKMLTCSVGYSLPQTNNERLKKTNILNITKLSTQTPVNLTLQFWENCLNFEAPLILPPQWSIQNDIEFATKIRGEIMGGAFKCIEKQSIRLKNGKFLQHCVVKGKNPNGNLTALLIGNSFAMNIVAAVAANPLFKKATYVFGNSVLFPIQNELENYMLEKLIKPMKPDVTFVIQRYYEKELWNTPIDKIKNNEKFQHWNEVFKIIQNYTSAIILNKEQINFPYDISQEYLRRKLHNLPIDMKLKNPPKSEIMEEWFKKLDCPKCAWFDYRDAFCSGAFCNVIDNATGLPIFRDTEHISIIGLRKLKPFIDVAIDKALNSNSNYINY